MLEINASGHRAPGLLSRFGRDEGGATAIEYGLIAALISVALVAASLLLGDSLNSLWDYVQTHIIEALTADDSMAG